MYYSKSTGGFYDTAVHGSRAIEVPVLDEDGEVIGMTEEPNPTCQIPTDAVEITATEYSALMAGQVAGQAIGADETGQPVLVDPPPLTDEELSTAAERSMELHMDAVAQADGWDNRWTCVARAGYPNPWQAKAIAFGQWMDACWEHAIQVRADVLAATRPAPTEEALIAELPVMVWPE